MRIHRHKGLFEPRGVFGSKGFLGPSDSLGTMNSYDPGDSSDPGDAWDSSHPRYFSPEGLSESGGFHGLSGHVEPHKPIRSNEFIGSVKISEPEWS